MAAKKTERAARFSSVRICHSQNEEQWTLSGRQGVVFFVLSQIQNLSNNYHQFVSESTLVTKSGLTPFWSAESLCSRKLRLPHLEWPHKGACRSCRTWTGEANFPLYQYVARAHCRWAITDQSVEVARNSGSRDRRLR